MDAFEKRRLKDHPITYRLEKVYIRYIKCNMLNLRIAKRKIKTFFQRGKRGWGVSDTWSFDAYLAKVISEGTRHLAEVSNGYPSAFENPEDWEKVLMKISKGFGDYSKYVFDDNVDCEKSYREAMELFMKHFESLWD